MSGSLEKALGLLRHLAASDGGMRLTELSGAAGVPAPSAHRLMKALEAEGFVERAPRSRVWRIGAGAAVLSRAAWRQFPLPDLAEPVMAGLTRETELTSYLSVVSGHDALCLLRLDGSGEVRTITMGAGTRRPLGIGAGSMALLAALPDAEAERLVLDTGPGERARVRGYDPRAILAERRQVQRLGYAEHNGTLIAGLCGLGAAGNALGRPFALSVSFIGSLQGEEKRARTRRLLAEAVGEVERRVREPNQKTAQARGGPA